MHRHLIALEPDDAGDWVAELDCGHHRHVRHRPPFEERPWVTTAAGRTAAIGTALRCTACERAEMPAHLVHYRSTPVFDADGIPAGLRANHATRAGVWGRIVVLEGTLDYLIEARPDDVQTLGPGRPGVVVAEQRHRVRPTGPVRFRVDFYRAARQAAC